MSTCWKVADISGWGIGLSYCFVGLLVLEMKDGGPSSGRLRLSGEAAAGRWTQAY